MFTSKWQAILAIVVGLSLTTFGVYSYFETQAFFKTAKETTATVSSVKTTFDSKGKEKNTIYYDYVVDGKNYSESESKTGRTTITQGEKYTIFYNPEDPSDARFETSASMLPWMCMGVGALALIIGLFGLMKKKKT